MDHPTTPASTSFTSFSLAVNPYATAAPPRLSARPASAIQVSMMSSPGLAMSVNGVGSS
jgi:hypothetical protein